MSASHEYLIFCDFDGTIARRDVGYHLMTHFSRQDNSDLQELWNARKIGARECLTIEASRIDASREEMLAYCESFEIDDRFAEFVKRAKSHNSRVIILSDGLDYYIRHLLELNGLNDLELHTNRARFSQRSMAVEFPYDAGCGVCGSCKGARIEEIVAREGFKGRTVFVGDGYSDLCALPVADVLFAKSDLRRYCESENISHIPFDTFAEVNDRLFG